MNEGMNHVTLFGNLGVEPELRALPGGNHVLKMRLATNHSWLNREGIREERTEWHQVELYGRRAEGLARVLHKGSYLLVEGRIHTSSYDKGGERRYYTCIVAENVFLGGRRHSPGATRPEDEGPDPDAFDGAFADVPDDERGRPASAEEPLSGAASAPEPVPASPGAPEPPVPVVEIVEAPPALPASPRGPSDGAPARKKGRSPAAAMAAA